MTTMGVTVFCNRVQISGGNGNVTGNNDQHHHPEQQVMLLRALHDNESNILSNQSAHLIVPKSNGASVSNSLGGGGGSVLPPYDPSRLKKHGKNGQPPPVAVARRNARERNRVKQVNNGFATLRQHIPGHIAAGYGDRGKKLSKVETLRMAVEYIRGLQRLLAEADGIEYDPNAGMQMHNVPSPTSSVISSSHNGSGERLVLDDEQDDEDVKPTPCLRLSPMVDSPVGEYYSGSIGDEENLEPLDASSSRVLGSGAHHRVGYSRLSPPTSVPSPCEFYAHNNEENLEPRQPLSPYSGGDSEEGGNVYPASPETFAGALYYKQEIPGGTGDMIDVVSWWEQEQGRLSQHTQQHLTHA